MPGISAMWEMKVGEKAATSYHSYYHSQLAFLCEVFFLNPGLVWNSESFCLSLLGAGITRYAHYIRFSLLAFKDRVLKRDPLESGETMMAFPWWGVAFFLLAQQWGEEGQV
jgi:hypothetical protein